MRPSSVFPTQLFRTLLLPLAVLGLAAAFHVSPVEARSEPQAELARCDFDPRFGGSVANRVDHGFNFLATVVHPSIGQDGLTYASFSELVLPDPEHPQGQHRLSIIRFGGDGRMDRTYGDDGFAHLPVTAGVVSLAVVGGKAVVLAQEFQGGNETLVLRLTGSGELDHQFGSGGVLSLGSDLTSRDKILAGVVGSQRTDVFSYDYGSSLLTHLVVDHHGRVQEAAPMEIRLGHIVGVHSGHDGRTLLTVFPPEAMDEEGEMDTRVQPQSIGGLASVVGISSPALGRDGQGIWYWNQAPDNHAAGSLTSIALDGSTGRSSPVRIGTNHDQLHGRVEAAITLPSGEIVVLSVDRSSEVGPIGTLYRFPDFAALDQGRFTVRQVDLNSPDSTSPPVQMLLDSSGGVRVFSGAFGTSVGHVAQARLLPHPVTIPESGAMVDQVDRLYLAAFGRVADAPGLGYWLNQRASGLPIISVANLFVQSAEFRSTYASPDEAAFVEILYGNVLGRPSDSEGLTYWTDRLTSGDLTRAEVLLAFSDSPEHVNTTASLPVNEASWTGLSRLYETALDRPADSGGFCYFVAEMQDGRSLSWVAQQMLDSAEFAARHDGTDASVVTAMYQGAFNRSPSESELNYWVSQLSSGSPLSALLLHISNSPEALRRLGY